MIECLKGSAWSTDQQLFLMALLVLMPLEGTEEF